MDTLRFGLGLAVIGACLSTIPAPAQQAPPTVPPCAADTAMHALDFWLGRWTVVDSAGTKLGDDTVEEILNGCAVTERWRGAEGDEGMSLFFYVPALKRWRQVWVTGQALGVGGLKEKELIARYPDGGTRFQGVLQGSRGVILDRTTLRPAADGRVSQRIEISRDGGNAWVTTFEATYVRSPP